ncbi:MAG TPA: ABC transporter permease [Trueperaceae bacterium]|nr:ABC transporter permease [Trueperaceae bacterium]HRP46116.1 ABC transporter permease [Trueperaceae bacterium]
MNRARFGTVLFVIIALAAVFAPQLSGYDPIKPDYRARYAPPSTTHPLGTDGLGRDVLARSLAGGRVSLVVALSATLLTLTLGGVLGVVAAGLGGVTDTVLSRVFDALLAFPGFLLILLVVASLGGGTLQTIMAMGVAGSPVFFRLARSFTRNEMKAEYVTAAGALGATRGRQLMRHAVPNFLGSMVVQVASTAAAFLLVEASLSFLGLGVPLPTPSWGNVLQDARSFLTTQPWAAVGPGVFLASASLSFQFMSDGMRDMLDRRS